MKKINGLDIGIVTLVLTAGVLLFGIARLDQGTQPMAFASGMTATSGEFIITVGSLNDRDEEMVYVIDTGVQRMASYRYETRQKNIELVQQMDLGNMFKSASEKKAPPAQGGRPSGNNP